VAWGKASELLAVTFGALYASLQLFQAAIASLTGLRRKMGSRAADEASSQPGGERNRYGAKYTAAGHRLVDRDVAPFFFVSSSSFFVSSSSTASPAARAADVS
jgi:hypothetical protein